MLDTLTKKPAAEREARGPGGRMAAGDRFEMLRRLVDTETPLIVDGGAHVGATIDLFLSRFDRPTIVAFEPVPELARRLREKYRRLDNVSVHSAALGATTRTISMNCLNYEPSSSILKPSAIARRYHGDKMNIQQVIEVEQVLIDDELANRAIDILKLDLQGYELEALKGATRSLSNTKVITTEVEFVPLYEGQPLFRDLDAFLSARGFALLNLYELYTQTDGQLTAGDAVYINTRFIDEPFEIETTKD